MKNISYTLLKNVCVFLSCAFFAFPSFGLKVNATYTTDDGWRWRYTTTDPADEEREEYIDGVWYYAGSAEITDYVGPGGDVAVPSTVTYKGNGYDCVAIVREVHGPDRTQEHGLRPHFQEYQLYATSLTIPDTVKIIGKTAFMSGSLLERVTFSRNLETLGSKAFMNCPKLKSVTLDCPHLNDVGWNVFRSGTAIEEVYVDGDGSLDIPNGMFADCTSLRTVRFGNGVKTIFGPDVHEQWETEDPPFENCPKIETIDFGGVEIVSGFGANAGSESGTLWDLDFTKTSVTNVTGFAGSPVRSLKFPQGMVVGRYAFQRCGQLRELIFPDDVVVSDYAFIGCTQLCAAVNSPVAGSLYYGCTMLTNAVLAADVKSIPFDLFYHCPNLNCISFVGVDALTSNGVYDGHRGQGVALFSPALTNYCVNALGGCDKISQIVFMGKEPSVVNDVKSDPRYGYDPPYCTVYVNPLTSGWSKSSFGTLPQYWPSTAEAGYWRTSIAYLPIEITLSSQCDLQDATIIRMFDEAYGNIPPLQREGHMFRGWFTKPTGGSYVSANALAGKTDKLYAHWLETSAFTHPVTVTYNLQDGVSDPIVMTYEANGTVDWQPENIWDNNSLMGWFTSSIGGEVVNLNEGAPSDDIVLYAHWAPGVWSFEIANGSAKLYGGERVAAVNSFGLSMTTPPYMNGYPVVDIGDWAFFGCTNLRSILVSEGVTNIGSFAFCIGYFMTNAVLPKTLQKIGQYAFVSSSQLECLDLHYRIGEICEGAFNCSSLITNVVVSTNTILGANAFCDNCVIKRAEVDFTILNDVSPDGKELFVSRDWIEDERFKTLYDEGDDAVTVLKKHTGKRDVEGNPLCVWHDYVAGTDPTDENDVFKAVVTMEDGIPVVTWEPALNGKGVKDGVRLYKVMGTVTLGGPWSEVNGNEADYKFFKVSVEMK